MVQSGKLEHIFISILENKINIMKTKKYIKTKLTFFFGIMLITAISCEREISEDAVPATFNPTAEVFTDAPVGLTDEFFISFDPAVGANTEGFGTDDTQAYEGSSSIKIAVPAPNDPNGSFIGGIFRDRGEGRDLTRYDALTFWAKGSLTGTIGQVGFGTDFLGDKNSVGRSNVQLTTDWKKYVIPIPNASILTQERGMFLFSAGSYDVLKNDNPFDGASYDDNLGWTFWIDEIRFENLGTIGQSRPSIYNGQNVSVSVFNDSQIYLNDLSQNFQLGTGEVVTINPSHTYYSFESSNANVVDANDIQLDSNGNPFMTVIGAGKATITANVDGVAAQGSLIANSAGNFPQPITPDKPAADVISLYSNSYTNVSVDTFRADFGSTGFEFANVNGNDVLSYNSLDFVGIQMVTTPVNATDMNFLHLDLFTANPATADFKIEIRDRGANGELDTNQFTGQPTVDDKQKDFVISAANITPGEWISIDIPLDGSLATQRNNIAQIVFVGNIDFFVDNLYFYK